MSSQANQERGGVFAPSVIVFAGPNGSGKSTINGHVLRDPELNFQGEYINADDIAKTLVIDIPDARERSIKAAELAESRRQTAMSEGRPFAFETVMSTPEKVAIMTQAKTKGYDVSLVFVTLDDPERNVQRVVNRVALGGHDVDPDTVRRRYHSSMALLACAVEHADVALIVDNSSNDQPLDVAIKQDGRLEPLTAPLPEWVNEKLMKPYQGRAESRDKIQKAFSAQCVGGASLPVVLADADASHGKIYRGKIVEVTAYHVLQQVGADKFVIHDRSLSMPQVLRNGRQATVGYAYNKGRIAAPALDTMDTRPLK